MEYIEAVVTRGHPVRSGFPIKTAKNLGRVEVGETVHVIGYEKYWFKIIHRTGYGYVFHDWVRGGPELNYLKEDAISREKSLKEEQNRQRIAQKQQDEEKYAQQRKQRLINQYGPTIANRILSSKIWIGMTKEMLQESLGSPYDINRTVTANHVSEQWVYSQGNYVYLDNNIVTSWQD